MVGPAPRSEDPHRWRRRLRTIPLGVLLATGLIALILVTLPALFLLDLVRWRRFALCRAAAFFALFAGSELHGLAAAGLSWLIGGRRLWGRRYDLFQHRLQHAWCKRLWHGLERCFGMVPTVEGAEHLIAPGPAHVLLRHVSTADTLIAVVFYAAPRQLWARFVLKRELMADPLLDVVGCRMGCTFVRRAGGEHSGDSEAMRRLGRDLDADEITVLYPEGTRFTPRRRAELLEKARAAGKTALVAAIERYQHTLPPRKSGPLALFEAGPQADLILIGHSGLEGTHSIASLLNGALIGQPVRIKVWRWSAAEMPADPEEKFAFLQDRWAELDAWVGEARA